MPDPGVRKPRTRSGVGEFCAACRVDVGECPDCGTFWWRRGSERMGMRRVGPGGGRCHWTDSADQLPQFVRENDGR